MCLCNTELGTSNTNLTNLNYTILNHCDDEQKQPSRGVLRKRCFEKMQKFTGKCPCRSVTSIKLLCNFIEITLRQGCSPVNLLHIFRTPYPKSTSRGLLLDELIQNLLYGSSKYTFSTNNKILSVTTESLKSTKHFDKHFE